MYAHSVTLRFERLHRNEPVWSLPLDFDVLVAFMPLYSANAVAFGVFDDCSGRKRGDVSD
jgi:hypothetical protein